MRTPLSLLFTVLLLVSIIACHPEEDITHSQDDKLAFSEDEVLFDTLFTSVGSVTKRLKVYNRNSKAVTISVIELAGKSASPYTITVNGAQGDFHTNVYLRGGDSMYVLVKVTIDPQNQSLPYLVEDFIHFTTNGNLQKVTLRAYGQDATFLTGATTGCDTVWTNIKPFVISRSLSVPAGCTLTLKKGVRVYFKENSYLEVKGTLLVEGEKDSLVYFSSDKLTKEVENLPGQWEGIVFGAGSKNNLVQYAEIRNANTGIKILNDPSDADTIAEVRMLNCTIKNMQGAGVEAYGTDVYAENTLFTNCVRQTFAGLGGGNYHFIHCDFTNYSYAFFREEPALELSNVSGALAGSLKARLTNCIVWGDRSNELQLREDGVNAFDFSARKSILKTNGSDQNVNGNLVNTDPMFESPVLGNFQLKAGSPAIDAAAPSALVDDLEGKVRGANPDIGALEK